MASVGGEAECGGLSTSAEGIGGDEGGTPVEVDGPELSMIIPSSGIVAGARGAVGAREVSRLPDAADWVARTLRITWGRRGNTSF